MRRAAQRPHVHVEFVGQDLKRHLIMRRRIPPGTSRVLAQAGIAVLPEYLVRKDIASGRLSKILPSVALISDWFRLIFRTDDPRRSIYEQIAAQMSEVPLK